MQTVYAVARKRSLFVIAAAALVLSLSTWLASAKDFSSIETLVQTTMYAAPAFMAPLFYAVTQLGSVGAIAGVVIAALVLKRRTLAALLLANSLTAYVLAAILKEL